MTAATHDAPALAARAALRLPYTHVDDIFINGAFESAAVGDGSDIKKGLDPAIFPVS